MAKPKPPGGGDDPRWIITVWVALILSLTAAVWYFASQPLPWLP